VAHGSGATCTATASTGYQFSAWTGAVPVRPRLARWRT
jgi:hypothetical protein